MDKRKNAVMAFILYVLLVVAFIFTKLFNTGILSNLLMICVTVLGFTVYIIELIQWRLKEKEQYENNNVILKEMFKYIPVLFLQIYFSVVVIACRPMNSIFGIDGVQLLIMFLCTVLIGPVYEEVIFRYLPDMFIKNKFFYITITSFIFAFLYVVELGGLWPYFIWSYLINSVYYGYRYSETKDLRVTVALHRINNFVALIMIVITSMTPITRV